MYFLRTSLQIVSKSLNGPEFIKDIINLQADHFEYGFNILAWSLTEQPPEPDFRT